MEQTATKTSTATKRRGSRTKRAQPQKELTTVQGTIQRVRFHNPDNGYCILIITPGNPLDGVEEVTVVGSMASIRTGDEYRFTGYWTTHPQFGKQLKFSQAELLLPTGKLGVARYISNITWGVGMAKAKKIVDALGEDALEKIKADPSVLESESLSFLKPEQRQEIAEDLGKNSVQAELAGMIVGQGIGMGIVGRIYEKYGTDSVKMVKENPYILADELWGVGFRKADAIGQTVGVLPNSPHRVEAAVNYALNEAGQEGHVFLKPSTVVGALLGKMEKGKKKKGLIEGSGVGVQEIAQANGKLINQGRCIREGDAIYAKALYGAEVGVAASIRRLLVKEQKEIKNLEALINETEEKYGVGYAPEQRQAINTALTSSISIITGGPGTGKTTVTNAIVDIYKKTYKVGTLGHGIYLAAPTGRAAKRMSEATGREAKTIHRLLKYNPGHGGFEYGYKKKLEGPGILIVDEASMIDIELAESLLAAVPDNVQVVLVGDIDQLPSVGPGSVLRDCISSGQVSTVRLAYNYRQAGGSIIANHAHLICQGTVPALQSEGDFEYVQVEDADQAAGVVLDLVKGLVADGRGVMDWQVLAPMRRGSCGVNALNENVRELVNPAKRIDKDGQEFGSLLRI